jgi:hypothetical protein
MRCLDVASPLKVALGAFTYSTARLPLIAPKYRESNIIVYFISNISLSTLIMSIGVAIIGSGTFFSYTLYAACIG